MLFRTIASIAFLACASNAAAEPQPYLLIKAPVQGLSLARRTTPGYQPDQSICGGGGNTCAEACGAGYEACPSEDKSTHCFNPTVKQTCCFDGTGNSCDAGYYCSHDTKAQTWCCPDSMDLAECAAAYGVKDGLKTEKLMTSTAASTSAKTTAAPTTTSALETTSTTVYITSTSVASTKSATATSVAVKTTGKADKTTVVAPSSGYSTAWSGSNSTIATAAPTQPSESAPGSAEPSTVSSGASFTGVSAMLLAAAGFFALL
ncbi:prp 4 c protein [Fusarium austroafricanum]|uniref:Prp 4 c protein n=1 Tax=Fusarium austroafricanum TaxID=2364996 RepID=A0A8H4KSG3_9HYPO|nr:prp 4 c protein [Fusarium austroafricanum]